GARAFDDVGSVVEAMQHTARLGPRLLEDLEHLVAGAALVDHEGETQLRGERDLGAEPLLLRLARGVIAVEVEPCLADGDDTRVAGRIAQTRPVVVPHAPRLARM